MGAYLPLGGMAVEAGLGGTVASALPVVHVEVELKVDHLSVELRESDWVGVHRTRRRGGGEGCVCRWEWDEEEEEWRGRAELITKSIANTNERVNPDGKRLEPVREGK